MMRYQSVGSDCIAIPNGRTKATIRPLKDPEPETSPLRLRYGSGSANPSNQAQENRFPYLSDPKPTSNNHETATNGSLLQWGHKKRSRAYRSENKTVCDESTSTAHSRQHVKIQRRAAIAGAEKIAAAAASAAMPPPTCGHSKGSNLRASLPSSSSTTHTNHRTVEERSGGQHRSQKRSPPHNTKNSIPNGFGHEASSSMNPDPKNLSDQDTGSGGPVEKVEKVDLEHFEWPRIYISLSRKEKEDDFMAIKGTKLPQRPKKRAKNVDKSLQYCFPGMWLSDLTRGRYEVREKKCVKKKRRGLKGMESMDSDSD